MKEEDRKMVGGFPRARSFVGEDEAPLMAERGRKFLRRVLRAKLSTLDDDVHHKKTQIGGGRRPSEVPGANSG